MDVSGVNSRSISEPIRALHRYPWKIPDAVEKGFKIPIAITSVHAMPEPGEFKRLAMDIAVNAVWLGVYLARLKRNVKTTLQEHAAEVEKLVNLAHADLPTEYRTSMLVDMFSATLGNAYLQRHLLAVHAPTLERAVRAGNEYLQIQPTNFRQTGRPSVTQVADEEDTMDEETSIQEVRTLPSRGTTR